MRDFTVEPAMSRDEAVADLEVGIQATSEAVDGGDCQLTDEMGTGNTSPAAVDGLGNAALTGFILGGAARRGAFRSSSTA